MKTTRKQREMRERQQAEKRVLAQQLGMEALTPSQLVERLADENFQITRVAWDTLLTRGTAALDALAAGLNHPNRVIRRECALLMDHLGDDRCVEPLRLAMRHDPIEAVRRNAMHSLACQGCKACPLNTDVVGALLEAALADRSKQVRCRAWQYLVGQEQDARVVAAVDAIREMEQDPIILLRAERALAWHTQASELG